MINVSGHLRNERRITGFYDTSKPFIVNCSGMQKFITRNYSQERLAGRVDYQLIYIFKGSGHYLLDSCMQTLGAGNLLFFKPGEPQVYSYYADEKPEIYWLHFTGSECENAVSKYNLHSFYIGEQLMLKNLFCLIMQELQLKKAFFEENVSGCFLEMLSLIGRASCNFLSPLENDFSIDRLIIELNESYSKDWDVSSMSDYCKLSSGYFSHLFKKRTGAAPMQYLNSLRLEKAKELIISDTIPFTEIASLVGFNDPLYFSRTFKKNVGISPRKFRQSLLASNTPDWYKKV